MDILSKKGFRPISLGKRPSKSVVCVVHCAAFAGDEKFLFPLHRSEEWVRRAFQVSDIPTKGGGGGTQNALPYPFRAIMPQCACPSGLDILFLSTHIPPFSIPRQENARTNPH